MTDIEMWRTATIITVAIGQTLFTSFYLTLPWWRTFLGRALFLHATTFCLLVDVAVAGRIWEWPGEETTFVVLYGITGIGVWAQFTAFVRQGRHHPPPLDDKEPNNHDHQTA